MADKVLEAIQTKKLREALESVRKKCQDLEEATNQALMVLNTKQVTQSKEILGGLLIDQKEQNQKKKKEKDSDDDDDDDHVDGGSEGFNAQVHASKSLYILWG